MIQVSLRHQLCKSSIYVGHVTHKLLKLVHIFVGLFIGNLFTTSHMWMSQTKMKLSKLLLISRFIGQMSLNIPTNGNFFSYIFIKIYIFSLDLPFLGVFLLFLNVIQHLLDNAWCFNVFLVTPLFLIFFPNIPSCLNTIVPQSFPNVTQSPWMSPWL